MILLSRSSGRLGNQLFQLSNTLNLRVGRQFVVFLGFNEAHAMLGRLAPRSVRIPVPSRLYHRAKKFFRWLQSTPGALTITRDSRSRAGHQEYPLVVELIDEQDCHYPAVLAGNDVLRRCALVATNTAHRDSRGNCFVHIRLGDYSSFIIGAGAVELPVSWFEQRMEDIRQSHPGIAFKVYSDEPSKVWEKMSIQSDTEVIEADAHSSFLGMARCEMGILSASTFSWWAAAIAHSTGASGPFIAPAGWENWRIGVMSHSEKITPWLSYRRVTA